jgi:predicted dehydrogenase
MKVGWGVLGAAAIAGGAVLPAIAASSNGRIVAIASRNPERARKMAAPYGDVRITESYEALLENPEVDAVYTPLANHLHKEWTLHAFAVGKHVLCEKPLAIHVGDAEEMAAAAQSSGKHLMEAFMYRFHPDVRAFIDQLRDPIHVNAMFGFMLKDADNFRLQAALGGGALLDVGCYTVSVARWILGEPVEVLARARVEGGVDLSMSALLQFEGGRTASLWASFESPDVQQLTVVTGEAVHRLESPFTRPREPTDPYRVMVESFANSILHDRPVAIPPTESIANMKVLDRIRKSAAMP